ncbi:hypothetical protein AAMO2058_001111400 [Amorphochlora amoebiformis]
MANIYPLKCPVQNYAWGKTGSSSAVALLSGQKIDEKSPYAELWMGTHHKGPAEVAVEGKSELLSKKIGQDLPYLFKVLSVAKALSIQAHPDKKLAEKLHKERPNVYKDPNHKPEMTCAVTQFEGMCGFRPAAEIAKHFDEYPEFKAIVGEKVSKAFSSAAAGSDAAKLKAELKSVFSTVMVAKSGDVKTQVGLMVKRLGEQKGCDDLEELILRLNKEYPLDVGVFAPLFLNHVVLQPGDAMFLSANEPHAYLKGDCIECMACSDNVVRAGLTPKLRDTPTLCSMLTYKAMKPKIMKGDVVDACSRVYPCPIDEFLLMTSKIAKGKSYDVPKIKGHALFLVYEGSGKGSSSDGSSVELKKGSVFFLKGGSDLKIEGGEEDVLLYRCSTASE